MKTCLAIINGPFQIGTTGAAVQAPVPLALPAMFSISAPVGPGQANRPPDIRVVQSLLNTASLKAGRNMPILIENGTYSQAFANAIRDWQLFQFGDADNIIEPGKRSMQVLNAIAANPGLDQSPAAIAIRRAPHALSWVDAAIHDVRLVQAASKSSPLDAPIFTKINTHFHLDRAPAGRREQITAGIAEVFRRMRKVLEQPAAYFVNLTRPDRFAEAPIGGYSQPSTSRESRIRFCEPYVAGLGAGPLSAYSQTGVIVHECAHFVSYIADIVHWADGSPMPNGTPLDSRRNYSQLLPDEALTNTESYKNFAVHAATNMDTR